MHGLAFCPIPGGFLEEVTPEQSGADSTVNSCITRAWCRQAHRRP